MLQEVLGADIADGEKRALLEDWDRVLALDLTRPPVEDDVVAPAEAQALAAKRDAAREAKNYAEADALRAQLEGMGWQVEDGAGGTRLRPRRASEETSQVT
jgi:cysteinyl-tRNA synthetase